MLFLENRKAETSKYNLNNNIYKQSKQKIKIREIE